MCISACVWKEGNDIQGGDMTPLNPSLFLILEVNGRCSDGYLTRWLLTGHRGRAFDP